MRGIRPDHDARIHGDTADGPIRAELLSPDRLATEARELADLQSWTVDKRARTSPLLALMDRAAEQLASNNRELAQSVLRGVPASPAAEWLLDNYYLIEEQVLLVREDLPRSYATELPQLTSGPLSGYPRLYELLLSLIAHTDSRLDEDTFVSYVDAYQQGDALSIGEVWAVPIMLRIALVENLRRLSASVVSSARSERAADAWAERLVLTEQDSPAVTGHLIEELDKDADAAEEQFLLRLAQRLQALEAQVESANTWLSRRLSADRIRLEAASIHVQQVQAANQASIANAIMSIRLLDALEWREFFERVSVVEAKLRADPVGVYGSMDFLSRDRYRHAVEQLAERSATTEIELAERAVALAAEALSADAADSVRGHVGWWLVSEGRYRLERDISYRPSKREWVYRGLLRFPSAYYGATLGGTLVLLLALLGNYAVREGAGPWQLAALMLLGLVPLSEIGLTVVNRLSAVVFPPRIAPTLDSRRPAAESHKTLVVVPMLLNSIDSARSLIESLEVAYLANRDPNIGFGMLGALGTHTGPDRDDDHRIIESAVRGIAELNERYEAEHGLRPFHLLIRGRTYSTSEDAWLGWERKRGALVELVREMRGDSRTTFITKLGDHEFRQACTFVITLDSDTILPRDGARRLIATIAHPLNRARFAPGDPLVRDGYGIVQPRVSLSLPGSRRSRFAHLYSGVTGIDPYAHAVSDTYQDVFGEGSFTGKGIFDVDLARDVLDGLFPEDTLLSHDLLEGSFLRTALANDIEVLDDYPANYLAASWRLHRWVRGDWQTLPYLFRRIRMADGSVVANPLTGLHRWKIIDNLRRSMVPPATLLLFTLGWLLLPKAALLWPLGLLALIFFPAYFSLAGSMVFRSVSFSSTAPAILRDFRIDSARGLLSLMTLPHQSWINFDAATRAVWRRFVSHRHLLDWETAADAEQRAGTSTSAFWKAMAPTSVAGVVLLAASTALLPERAATGALVGGMWLLAPWAAWWFSQPFPAAAPAELSADERLALRRVARKTWRFFEAFVVRHGNYLAPDNYQEDPTGVVAWRTSPTNIGLQLLSDLGAYDLGYLDLLRLNKRVAATLKTMAGLERFNNHFYNWYDIRTLEPLRPAYVSTVDSGNLVSHLIALRMGLLEVSESPIFGPQVIDGLRDSVHLALEDLLAGRSELVDAGALSQLQETLDELERLLDVAELPTQLGGWTALLTRADSLATEALDLVATVEGLEPAVQEGDVDDESAPPDYRPPVPTGRLERLRASVAEVCEAADCWGDLARQLVPWASLLEDTPAEAWAIPELEPLLRYVPSLTGLAEGLIQALRALEKLSGEGGPSSEWAAAVHEGITLARPACIEQLELMRHSADVAREFWEHTDFSVLYDPHRSLFSIGYNLSEGRLDASYYDLLASECRVASFVAVAKGDVGQEHWFRLGRPLTPTPQGRALVSWSASMFEYLMPMLVMRSWPDTLLSETCSTVVHRQIAYGDERSVPWGVSESAFNARDAHLTYQYQAFGIPGLGLKRGLSDDVVVAPYASMLSLPVEPRAVIANLARLRATGAEGDYGFYESIDYTPGRVPAGSKRAVVRAYFSHHHGMSFVALCNALHHSRMQQRFHSDATVASAELLLQERLPRHVQLVEPHIEEVHGVRSVEELLPPETRTYPTAATPVPATHFLSNGSYSVMITNGGGGYSRWRDLAVTRYREDVTRDCWGTFFYVRNLDTGEVFSAPHNPCPREPEDYLVTFAPDKAEFRRVDGDLETRLEVSVSPEDDVEVRRLTFGNLSSSPIRLEVTSYFEVAVTKQASDQAHKSFSNLFIETEALEQNSAVIFTRRRRSDEEAAVWGFHLAACEQEHCDWSCETDRARFIGRLRSSDDPAALDKEGPLSGTVGAVLDPCCAIRRVIEIPEGQSVRVMYATGISEERDTTVRLTEKYADPRNAQRAIDLAWTTAQLELRDLGITPDQALVLDRLASRLLLTDPHSPLKVKTPVENGLQMSGLWSLGVSGDLPILLIRVEELAHAPLVRQALLAHQYWRHKGLVSDLVILNTRPTGYTDQLDDRLRLLVRTGHALQMLDKPGGVFLRRADQMHPDVLTLLLSVARATLDGDSGTLELQLNRRGPRIEVPARHEPTAQAPDYPPSPFERPELLFDNGLGGFDPKTGEYVVVLRDKECTPAPWINVLASPTFGCTVSEAGVGCTWALNSHENRITTWNNDAVSDGSGEAIYVRDEETGEYWSPTPLPVRTPEPYLIRHGKGSVRFEHETHGIGHTLDYFVAMDEPVRVCRLSLENRGSHPRRLSVTQLVEWVLGESRSRAQQLVVTWFDSESSILTAHNHYNFDFPGRCAFLASNRPLRSWTASRTEFVGRNGTLRSPEAMRREGLGGASGRYHDNCGALQVEVSLSAGETAEVCFFLGQTATLQDCRDLVERFRKDGAPAASLEGVRTFWDELLGAVTVETPDTKLDLLMNGQLLYQATACRLWGRTATYQSGGAFGFRDQLQDVMALLIARPELVREQIVEAARHQFAEGDVLHWWQPFSGRGVRTHITDDRHWLPLLVAEYLDATGDESVLDETIAFIEGPPLPLEAEDAYLQPAVSEQAVSVYEHCIRALETGRPVGPHGLPLMGGGDWNDGMNRVGHKGQGESIWLAWFLGYVLTRFGPVCARRGESDRADDYGEWAKRLAAAVEESGWDGSWYRRAYFDDGTPLGTHEAEECRIDAVAQAWATISGLADPGRAAMALESLDEKLIRWEDGLIALLTPPFDKMDHDPGYIKGYVPGVRENGGQYTHAALWTVLAYLLQGEGDHAVELLDLINPISHTLDPDSVARYKVEPYVVAADVYAVEPHVGRGGWTWYTGSASWFYRIAIENLLGLSVHAEGGSKWLTVAPCIPKAWSGYAMSYRHGQTRYSIRVESPRAVNAGVAFVELDGVRLEESRIRLEDDGQPHEVRVVMLGG